ncbi:MAG: hypothetical protein J7K94_00925 [Dehalococcoidia bacterium]|nr:hypothetical protein [Dehalococcoidia bacterium]
MRCKRWAGILSIILAVVVCSAPLAPSPVAALDLNPYDYYQVDYLVSFSDNEVQEGEVFYLDITGQVTCIRDMPFGADRAEVTEKFVAQHRETGDTKVLNEGYTVVVDDVPDWAGETCQFDEHIGLSFPPGSQPGDYDVIGQTVHADIDGWDVTDLIPESYKSRTIGMVTCVSNLEEPSGFAAVAAGTSQVDLSWVKGDGATGTKIVRKEGGYPADRDDGIEVYFGGGNGASDVGLSPNTHYYYSAWSWNDDSGMWSDSYATVDVVTRGKPGKPAGFFAVAVGIDEINLFWTKGDGATGTKIVRREGRYPTSRSNGVEVYFGSGSSASDTDLLPDRHYYYSAWSWDDDSGMWSDDYATADAVTGVEGLTVVTGVVTGIEATSATCHGNILSTGGEDCDRRGVCWSTSPDPDVGDNKQEDTGSFDTGAFAVAVTGLSEGTSYYVRACAHNSEGYSYGDEVAFTTAGSPSPPLPPSFVVSNLTISPGEVEPGQVVTISVMVRNEGGTEGSYALELVINGEMQSSREITLAPGEGRTVSYQVSKSSPGNYEVMLGGQSGGFTVVVVEPSSGTSPAIPSWVSWVMRHPVLLIIAMPVLFFFPFLL